MDCCTTPGSAQSWIDWIHAMPMDPFTLIQNAMIGGAPGVFVNSSNYASNTWAASPVALKAGATPTVTALETDNLLKVAEAAQWNFSHLTNNAAATLPPALAKVIFLRGGPEWQMTLPLDLGGATYTNLQLSFRDNAGTRGDSQGTVPVLQWVGSFSGATTLLLTFKGFGRFVMGLRCDTGSAVSMYETEWIIVP